MNTTRGIGSGRVGVTLLVMTVFLFVWGCAGLSRQESKTAGLPSGAAKETGEAAKPAARSGTGSDGASTGSKSSTASPSPSAESQTGLPTKHAQSEAGRVREVAQELAKKLPKIEHIKICQDRKRDEWWITLYQDAGFRLDLKQYIWSRTKDKPDPFTVLRSIPKTDLRDHLNESSPDRKCTAFRSTDKGWSLVGGDSLQDAPAPTSPTAPRQRTGKKSPRGSHSDSGRLGPLTDRPRHAADQVHSSITATSTSSTVEYIFTYGSEMNHPDLLRWIESRGSEPSLVLDAEPARLDGHDLVWNYFSSPKQGGTANLEPRKNHAVWGLLLAVHPSLIEVLDRREGHPTTYSRGEKKVPVRLKGTGKTVKAWLYVAKPNRPQRRNAWPTRGYKRKMVEAARFWDFPSDYVQKIESWRTR